MAPFDETWNRLENWGRWARADSPGISYPSGASGMGEMLHDSTDREGWGNTGAMEKNLGPIDERDADIIDKAIMRIPAKHVITIKRKFYRLLPGQRRPSQEEADAAVRALADYLSPFSRIYPSAMRVA